MQLFVSESPCMSWMLPQFISRNFRLSKDTQIGIGMLHAFSSVCVY